MNDLVERFISRAMTIQSESDGSNSEMYLGVNMYLWDRTEQNEILMECLEPTINELRERLGSLFFWFDRFDARGPHVVAMVRILRSDRSEVVDLLSTRINSFLAAHTMSTAVTRESAELRHKATGSRAYCELDRAPGLAIRNSYEFFEQTTNGYPLWLTQSFPEHWTEELWHLVSELSSWSMRELKDDPSRIPTRSAIWWMATLDRELQRLSPEAESYWRYYASSLLPELPRRLETGEKDIIGNLLNVIGERNVTNFGSLWEGARRSRCARILSRLIECIFAATKTEASPAEPWPLLREIAHWTLKQLGLYVQLEIPLVLFAWHRNLASLPEGSKKSLEVSAGVAMR